MPIQFLVNNQAEEDKKIARALIARENEIRSYMYEQESHERVISENQGLEYPEHLLKYKGMGRDAIITAALAEGLSEEDVQLALKLVAGDMHRHQLQAVKAELAKSETYYNDLLVRLPEGERRDNAMAAVLPEFTAG
jgi:hypothetical protein